MERKYTIEEVRRLEEGWFFYDHAWQLLHHLMTRVVGRSLLDVGCGTGAAMGVYKNFLLNTDVQGLEFADANIEFWKARSLNVTLGSATDIPFPDDSFDTITSSHVIEHIEDHERAVMEMVRVAKRKVLLVVPDGDVDAKNFGSPHLRHYNRVNFSSLVRGLAGGALVDLYSLPHPHMNNLIAEIRFD